MCGIAGYIGPNPPNPDRLYAASEALRHRGPDGQGVFTHRFQDQSVALVHRRLAIIDLDSRSDQPFDYQGTVLVYNGEIYNYLEVRRELEGLGHVFRTSGDTEVLIHALRQWGRDALDKLEGMWAFAWYDQDNGTLLLSRDRFGEKPLYLWEHNGGLYFASEVKGLAALAGEFPEINTRHILRYLVNGYKSLYKAHDTFFHGVRELPPAHCLMLHHGRQALSPYWKPVSRITDDMTYQEAVEGAREALIRSVGLRLRSDVPLAFCMSGGVDSNALISIAKRVFDYDVHGFTIINQDERYAEQELVDLSVRELGIRHTAIPIITSNFLARLKNLVAHHDAPVYTITYYAHWLLMEAVEQHGYRISVSGTAADELFSGYYDHHGFYLHEMHRLHKGLFDQALENWKKHIQPIVRNPLLQDPLSFIRDPEQRGHIYLDNELFARRLTRPFIEPFAEERFCPGLMRNRMLNELFREAVPVILHEDDLNAMFYSIENRSPFLDRDLFDFCYSMPTAWLIRDGFNKAVLRDAMRGIVPEPVLASRRKVGFNAPIFSFLDVADPEVRGYLLDDSVVFDIVQKESIREILAKDYLPNSESKFLFSFLGVKMFMEEFG